MPGSDIKTKYSQLDLAPYTVEVFDAIDEPLPQPIKDLLTQLELIQSYQELGAIIGAGIGAALLILLCYFSDDPNASLSYRLKLAFLETLLCVGGMGLLGGLVGRKIASPVEILSPANNVDTVSVCAELRNKFSETATVTTNACSAVAKFVNSKVFSFRLFKSREDFGLDEVQLAIRDRKSASAYDPSGDTEVDEPDSAEFLCKH